MNSTILNIPGVKITRTPRKINDVKLPGSPALAAINNNINVKAPTAPATSSIKHETKKVCQTPGIANIPPPTPGIIEINKTRKIEPDTVGVPILKPTKENPTSPYLPKTITYRGKEVFIPPDLHHVDMDEIEIVNINNDYDDPFYVYRLKGTKSKSYVKSEPALNKDYKMELKETRKGVKIKLHEIEKKPHKPPKRKEVIRENEDPPGYVPYLPSYTDADIAYVQQNINDEIKKQSPKVVMPKIAKSPIIPPMKLNIISMMTKEQLSNPPGTIML